MLQRVRRWFRDPRPKCFTLSIAIDKPNVVVSVDWADPENLTNKEIMEEASRTAKTLIAITNGDGPGLNEIQRAIGKNAELRKDQGMANALFAAFRENNHSPGPSINLDEQLMNPIEVFPVPG